MDSEVPCLNVCLPAIMPWEGGHGDGKNGNECGLEACPVAHVLEWLSTHMFTDTYKLGTWGEQASKAITQKKLLCPRLWYPKQKRGQQSWDTWVSLEEAGVELPWVLHLHSSQSTNHFMYCIVSSNHK